MRSGLKICFHPWDRTIRLRNKTDATPCSCWHPAWSRRPRVRPVQSSSFFRFDLDHHLRLDSTCTQRAPRFCCSPLALHHSTSPVSAASVDLNSRCPGPPERNVSPAPETNRRIDVFGSACSSHHRAAARTIPRPPERSSTSCRRRCLEDSALVVFIHRCPSRRPARLCRRWDSPEFAMCSLSFRLRWPVSPPSVERYTHRPRRRCSASGSPVPTQTVLRILRGSIATAPLD